MNTTYAHVGSWPILFLGVALAGCGGGNPDAAPGGTASPAASSSKPRVALVMKSLANEFFKTMADGAEKHQREHVGDYELMVNGIKDERDLSRQVALVDEMIAQGVSAIVIAPADSRALVSACKRAKDAGIVVVNIDNKLDAAVLADQGIAVPFVGPDNRAGARKVGEYLAKRLKPGDQVGMLEGIRTAFNGQQRQLGFQDAMKAAGLSIVDSQTAQWEMDQANRVASAMLSEHPQIKALLCCNDSMALGGAGGGQVGRPDGQGPDCRLRRHLGDPLGHQGRLRAGHHRAARRPACGLRHRTGAQADQGRRPARRHHDAGRPDHGGVDRGKVILLDIAAHFREVASTCTPYRRACGSPGGRPV